MKIEKLKESFDVFGENEVILDARTEEEYQEGHIPGAINIPHDKVQEHVDELRNYDKVHIHCKSGRRAQLAAKTLADLGLSNIHCIDDSGIEHWVERGYPID